MVLGVLGLENEFIITRTEGVHCARRSFQLHVASSRDLGSKLLEVGK